ncbi:protein max-like isoform X1 [Crassostrea angulata]|uniref:Protein max n=2 Tax=Magallana gigas TaxID=29159 RepID=K1PW70_MAGGI|nr:protein max isoform X1 [Crassostrea gigas]XP_052700630.1 protein max-like isoform X1 [Crassostrea angulata]|eukprot:XP_011431516.1 PREDICTED: protein max isoform X1 [Crassostrea gigas]
MSDEDREVEIESDEEDDELGGSLNDGTATQFMSQAEKRAHHNALERKRRDHIKDSFHSLRDSVPALQGEKVGLQGTSQKVSRAQILKKAADYISFMRRKNHSHQQDIDDLKKHNAILEQQIRALEKAKTTGQFAVSSAVNAQAGAFEESESESSIDGEISHGRRKKLKTSD